MRRRRKSPATVTRHGEPRLRSLPELVRLPRRSPLHGELFRALHAAHGLHGLRTNLDPVPVRATSTTSQAGCYRLRDGDPIDLRVSRRHGRVALSFLHELGHFVDHQLAPERGRAWASGSHAAFAGWREGVAGLPHRALPGSGRSRRRYFESTRELWARSYAQAVLLRSGDRLLRSQLALLVEADDPCVWPPEAFEEVAREVERVFERLALLQLELFAAA